MVNETTYDPFARRAPSQQTRTLAWIALWYRFMKPIRSSNILAAWPPAEIVFVAPRYKNRLRCVINALANTGEIS
jgi:hypothetical protein